MTTIQHIMSAAQLLEATDLGPCELVRGELIMMSPSGFQHGRIANRIAARLEWFVAKHSLGVVTTAEAGYQIGHDPDTVRAPDVAFVRTERIPSVEPKGYYQGAPDLAVEVVSPGDRASDVLAKAQEWLAAGCRAVWVVDPKTSTVSVHRSPREITVLHQGDLLEGGEVLPGFSLPVGDIFGA
jgi:Uma2 family endonuclease